MKNVFCLILLGLSIGICAYGGGRNESAPQEFTLKLAHIYQPAHAHAIGSKKLGEAAKEKSRGKLVINDYPAGQLGSINDIADAAVNGEIEMVILSTGVIGKRYTPWQIFEGPFLLSGYDHYQKVMNSDIATVMKEECRKQTGLRTLTTWYYGTRYVTSKKLIKTPGDMKGMKLRTPDEPMSVANAKAMGANPTPMALSEVYLALQQNVVDGQENPIPTIYTQKFYEVQDYIIMTGHLFQVNPIMIIDKVYEGLPSELKKALDDSIAQVSPAVDKLIIDDEKKMLSEMQAKGMKVVQPDVDAFVQATSTVYKQFESYWGPELYAKIQAFR
jgi:tripartite ATP-independent transporter DctP family solute receptor